jgi:hypothetical protein
MVGNNDSKGSEHGGGEWSSWFRQVRVIFSVVGTSEQEWECSNGANLLEILEARQTHSFVNLHSFMVLLKIY